MSLSVDDGGDWPEDFSHENGNYQNTCLVCCSGFMGHKRRVTCRRCATEGTPRVNANTYGGAGIIGAGYVSADFARRLERELIAMTRERDELVAKIASRSAHIFYKAGGQPE